MKNDNPETSAARQARYVASGRQIACVIREPAAISALASLVEIHGGVTAAVTASLLEAFDRSRMPRR